MVCPAEGAREPGRGERKSKCLSIEGAHLGVRLNECPGAALDLRQRLQDVRPGAAQHFNVAHGCRRSPRGGGSRTRRCRSRLSGPSRSGSRVGGPSGGGLRPRVRGCVMNLCVGGGSGVTARTSRGGAGLCRSFNRPVAGAHAGRGQWSTCSSVGWSCRGTSRGFRGCCGGGGLVPCRTRYSRCGARRYRSCRLRPGGVGARYSAGCRIRCGGRCGMPTSGGLTCRCGLVPRRHSGGSTDVVSGVVEPAFHAVNPRRHAALVLL
jgi:hypothetical protein